MAVLNYAPIKNNVLAQGGWPRRFNAVLTGTCIVHTSEGNWRNGVNNLTELIATRNSHGSYHRAVDWEDVAIYFDWEWECWQDSETNPWAVGISAACKTEDWGKDYFIANGVEEGYYRNLARAAADFVVYMKTAKKINVPLKRISGAQARAGVPGFCAHGDSGIARSDPGSNFDWARFFKYVQEALVPSVIPTPVIPKELFTVGQFEDIMKKLQRVEDIAAENQRRIGRIPDSVWDDPTVLRGGKKVSVKQELADIKSIVEKQVKPEDLEKLKGTVNVRVSAENPETK